MTEAGLEIRYRKILGPLHLGLAVFLMAQTFMPALQGGFIVKIPVVGPYVSLILGVWVGAMGLGYLKRPAAIVWPARLIRLTPILGKRKEFHGQVRLANNRLEVLGHRFALPRFLIEPEDWDTANAHLTGAKALD